MARYMFDARLFVSVTVEAASEAEARGLCEDFLHNVDFDLCGHSNIEEALHSVDGPVDLLEIDGKTVDGWVVA